MQYHWKDTQEPGNSGCYLIDTKERDGSGHKHLVKMVPPIKSYIFCLGIFNQNLWHTVSSTCFLTFYDGKFQTYSEAWNHMILSAPVARLQQLSAFCHSDVRVHSPCFHQLHKNNNDNVTQN